jgi:lipopolysaccharide transport system ATP-binding protein
MDDVAIRLENLGKQYRIGRLQGRHDTLRDALVAGLHNPLKRLRRDGREAQDSDDSIWALKNVSLEVKRGEAVGIIGRNGAGKSTLLKILSRITEPTEGRAVVVGRVSSLLEVGTGFHPELTGRENIYLNGAILGMHRAEIERKFDEIVAFAEIEKFLETPVKRYSSGMYVRLAFAVAAHLEPEILLVDEVLAVGDGGFQKKCLGRMDEVTAEGRTILFVSHNMSAIQRLCPRSIMLDHGQPVAMGRSSDVVAHYSSAGADSTPPAAWIDVSGMSLVGSGEVRFEAIWFSSLNESLHYHAYSNGPLEFNLAVVSDSPRSVGSMAVVLFDEHGTKLVNADTLSLGESLDLRKGLNRVRLRIDELHLMSGVYTLGLWMADPVGTVFDGIRSAARIEVITPETEGLGVKPTVDGVVTCNFSVVDVS